MILKICRKELKEKSHLSLENYNKDNNINKYNNINLKYKIYFFGNKNEKYNKIITKYSKYI